jgi:hypothetical protein
VIDLVGAWSLVVETPFGQNIPVTMVLTKEGEEFSGQVQSDLGAGNLVDIKVSGNEFSASISLDVQGQKTNANIAGTVDSHEMKGRISLPNLPVLPFSGRRES